MRILVIDDDKDSCDFLRMFLKSQGFDVSTTNTGEEGLQMLPHLSPDLVILDVMLPQTSGFDICQQIRASSDVPILMVSAFASEAEDMVRGLETGADDYLTKPFNFGLLKAHMLALLRRSRRVGWREGHPAYVDSYLVVDLQHKSVLVRGQPVFLPALEYQLLEFLVCNANQAVPTLEIMEHLWPGQAHTNNTDSLRACMKRLRDAIEPQPHTPLYIINEYGVGYRFVIQG